MKIKLITPARKKDWGGSFWELKHFARLSGLKAAGAPLSLPSLAALTPDEIEVSITDENIEPIDFEAKVDLVGISFLTSLAPRAYEIADIYRAGGTTVILGGIHASMLPDEAILHADSVVIGEAEEVWPKVIADFRADKLQRFYRAECYPDLESSPIPRWDLLKTNAYAYFMIQVGRGCPYDCDFCAVHVYNGHKYRHKSKARVVSELEALKDIDPKKPIFFADDNLLAKPDYMKELLAAIEPLNIRFWAQASINRLADQEMPEALYRAGCRMVFVGLESVTQKSLDGINKGRINDVTKYKEVINRIHSAGISVVGSFVLGLDSDDAEVFKETADFILDSNIAFPMVNILTPLPGTRLHSRLKDEQRILSREWQNYDCEHACIAPQKMSVAELLKGRNRLLRELNSYPALYGRLNKLWNKGTLVRNREKAMPLVTRGRIWFTLKSLANPDVRRTWFVLKSAWHPKVSSISSVALALGFHDYVYSLSDQVPV